MPRCAPESKAAKATTRPRSRTIDDISSSLSNLTISREGATGPPLWFLPDRLGLPPHNKVGPSHTKRPVGQHVPKPRNAYMLFRSHLVSQGILPPQIKFCRQSQQVSRIVSHIWRSIHSDERKRFYMLVDEEKRMHQSLHPGYTITETKTHEKGDQTTNGNFKESNIIAGTDEYKCMRIAQILLSNVQGDELVAQIREVADAPSTLDSSTVKSQSTGRAGATRGTSKADSSVSKTRPSKASLDHVHARVPAASRVRNNISYVEGDDEEVADYESTPPASVSVGSPDISRNDGFEALLWSTDGLDQKQPFDYPEAFDVYEDDFDSMVIEPGSPYAEFGVHYPLEAQTQYSTLNEVKYEDFPMIIPQDPYDDMDQGLYENIGPQSISPDLLH